MVRTIDISSFSFAENTSGVVIGDLSVIDPTFSPYVTFSVAGEDGDLFEIVNGQLKLKDNVSANFEVQDTCLITLKVVDDTGLEASVNFILSVTDEADAPTGISISQAPPPPPPPPPGGEDETITVTVSVVDGQFYFNGELASALTLIEGNTYIFTQYPTDGNGGNVLAISESEGGSLIDGLEFYISGSSYSASYYDLYLADYYNYFSDFEIHYTVPEGGADTLYFYSTSSAVTGGAAVSYTHLRAHETLR